MFSKVGPGPFQRYPSPTRGNLQGEIKVHTELAIFLFLFLEGVSLARCRPWEVKTAQEKRYSTMLKSMGLE